MKTISKIEYNSFTITTITYIIGLIAITNLNKNQLVKASIWYLLATIGYLGFMRNEYLKKRKKVEESFEDIYQEFHLGKGPSMKRFLQLKSLGESSYLSNQKKKQFKNKVNDITTTYLKIAERNTNLNEDISKEDLEGWLEIITNLSENPSYHVRGGFLKICTIIYQINHALNSNYSISQLNKIKNAFFKEVGE